MIQLQQKYALRLEKMELNSLCFFFLFWISIYALLMIVNHLGPSLYTSQFINSPINRCVDEILNRTSQKSMKLPYYQCSLSLKTQEYGIKDIFLIRVIALLNNKNDTFTKEEHYQIQMSQLVDINSDTPKPTQNNEFLPKDIEYDENFPYLDESKVDLKKWQIVSNNKTSNISYNCNVKSYNQESNFDGCFSKPIFEEQRENLKQEYSFFIRINKNQVQNSEVKADSPQNTLPRILMLEKESQIQFVLSNKKQDNHRFLQEIANEEHLSDETESNQSSTEEIKDKVENKQESKESQPSKIRKILFQLKYKNSNHQLEMIMKSLYSIVSAGFLIYTMLSLKNFYIAQLISIQKWIRYLLAFLLVYNSPIHLFFPNNSSLLIITRVGELIFLSLIMYFWLSIKSMNRPSSAVHTVNQPAAQSQLKIFKNFFKIILVCLHNAPRLIWSIFIIGGTASFLSNEDNKLGINFENVDIVQKLAIGTFFIYGLCVFGAMLKVCIESTVDRNFKFLCYFTYSVFFTYGYICYQEFYIPEENQSSYFMLNKETILNLYVYVISYLYLPVENKNDEQQYHVDHENDEDEDEEQKHKEIIGEVYKDIEMDDTIKHNSHIHDTSAEQKKQKLWESIQKSIEDEDEGYEEKKDQDSDSLSDSDEEEEGHTKDSSAKKLEQNHMREQEKRISSKKNKNEQQQSRQQKFVDDAQEELDDKEFIFE